ncbi:tumor suppressor, Mitostatin-domain-containing protein [Haematococcus lacustris]
MPPQDRFAKLREYEDRLAVMKSGVKDEARAAHIVTWQAKSDEKLRHLTVQRRFEAAKQRRESDLNARRQRLAEKLIAEDAALKDELLRSRETPEQRRAKLAERARQLATKRESRRQELAAQLQEKAFEENCDVLRQTHSKRILYRTLDERSAQIEQKMAQRIVEEEETRMFAEMNETQRLKAEQRHLDDKQRDRERRQATIKVLDQQVLDMEQRRRDEADARRQEIAELQALWSRMEQEQQAAEAQDRERMRRLAAELQEFNRLRQSQLSKQERRERELDLQILQEALSREAAEEAREAAAREKRAADIRRYRDQLVALSEKDAEDDAARDAIVQFMADQQRAKQDAEWAAREAARARLMAEVDEIRQQQIRDKQARLAAGQQEVLADRERVEADLAAMRVDTAAQRAALNKRALEQKLQLQTQMVAKAHIKASEEDEKLRALESAQEAEAMYMGQVQTALQRGDPSKWHGRKKVDWYH